MSIYNKIQALSIRYADQSIGLSDFRAEFVPLFLSIERQKDAEAAPLAAKIEGLFADLSEGFIGEALFRERILRLFPIVVSNESTSIVFGTAVIQGTENQSTTNSNYSPGTYTSQFAAATACA